MNKLKKLTIRTKLTILNVALLIVMCIVLTLSINASAKTMVSNITLTPVYKPHVTYDPSTADKIHGEVVPAEGIMSSEIITYAQVSNFIDSTYIYLAIIVIVGGIATHFIIKRQVKPIEQLTDEIQHLTSSNLSSEIKVNSNSCEIQKLTQAFNEMTANLQKSFDKQKRFSQMSAHEFRTPLAVMKTKIQVFKMKKEHTDSDYTTLVDTILSNTERLTSVIDSLLALSNEEKTVKEDVINFKDVTEYVAKDLYSLIQAKSTNFSADIENFEFIGNKTLFTRAIFNLCENAIKYNDDGTSITVTSKKNATDFVVEIYDDGIGIPDEFKEKIFDPFFTVDKSRSRAVGGAGLGLSLVNEIVSKHNGKIVIEDNKPKGAKFIITIPLE